jgi:hypothetical protein
MMNEGSWNPHEKAFVSGVYTKIGVVVVFGLKIIGQFCL